MKTSTARRWLTRFLLLATLSLAPVLASAAGPDQQGKLSAVPSHDASQYVGSDTCKTCHEDVYKKQFEATPHFKTTLGDGHGCESCHGPGSAHVDGGGNVSKIISFEKLSRQESSERCLSCHGEAHEQRRFAQSSHDSNDVGCLDCHSPHHAKDAQFLLVQKQPQLCYGCHTSAKADFAKPYHHRVEEGSGPVQRLPQRPRNRHRAPGAHPAQRRLHLLQMPRR